jgi:2-dehydropantoate 2-reductase
VNEHAGEGLSLRVNDYFGLPQGEELKKSFCMKIAVIGAGGVGGYFGGKLSQAGNDVLFLTRGEALEVIGKEGLRVKSYLGDFTVYPEASDKVESIASAELILFCTKSWQLDEVARSIQPFLKEGAVVLPLQNGADNASRLKEILLPGAVLGGLCKIVSKIESPGVIDHFTFVPEIVFGELSGQVSDRARKIKEIFDQAGFKNRLSENIERDIWLKFLFIASISAMGTLTRSVLGVMREDPFIRSKIRETALEIVAVGQALGVDLFDEDLERTFDMIDNGDYDTTMSLQRDMMEGRPSELENFNGFIVKKGDSLGIDTPVNDFIYFTLLPMEKRARSSV